MVINSISFFKAPGAVEDHVVFYEYYVYMGYCASTELGADFNDNYINGVKYTVLERTDPITFYDTDPTIYFDSPFFYDPANGNLVLEIAWPDGRDEIYTYSSSESTTTCVYGSYDSSTGDQFYETPHILLNGEMALSQTTFAGIKALFR
jgi:hypothetical protein